MSGTKGTVFDWQLALHHFSGSGCVAWPMDLVPLPHMPNVRYVRYDAATLEPSLISILDWTDVTAVTFRWKAWSSQVALWPDALALGPAVRAIALGEEKPLAIVAADAAYWDIDLTTLKKLSTKLRYTTPRDANLPEQIVYMIAEAKKLSS